MIAPVIACPKDLPGDLVQLVAAFGKQWACSPVRPRVRPEIRAQWETLLEKWLAAEDLPLFVRRPSEGRGKEIRLSSGRIAVPTDNSPAHWSFSLALEGEVPTLDAIRAKLAKDEIPVAMVVKRRERDEARYRCARSAVSLNELGWKVAHIDDVGLGRLKLETTPESALRDHFRKFLAPANMFLVPLKWAGLAEVQPVIDAIREADGGLWSNQT